MGAKINKALDYNKLKEQQKNGKMLKKKLKFPLIVSIKWDGNYTVTSVLDGNITHYTSGGLTYTSTDEASDIFKGVVDGYYLAERCGGTGKLGERVHCNLTGSKDNQKSTGHFYKVFDYLTPTEYIIGQSLIGYNSRLCSLKASGISFDSIEGGEWIENQKELDDYLDYVTGFGYEGLMLMEPSFKWSDTTSRKTHLCKYKKRPTADLKCIGVLSGAGKYTGMIGSLLLEDSEGRRVKVGAGLSDEDRGKSRGYFVGNVIEIEYEQIIDTYIQPTYIQVRKDKVEGEID